MSRVAKTNEQKLKSIKQSNNLLSSASLFKLSGFNMYDTYKKNNISVKLAKIKKKSKSLS